MNAKGGRLGPVDFVRMMEEALIRLCGVYGVRAGRIAGLTGVWCGLHLRTVTLFDEARPKQKSARSARSGFMFRAELLRMDLRST